MHLTWADLEAAAEREGLYLRGGFHFQDGEEELVISLENGTCAASLVLLGNVGSSLWSRFTGSPEYSDGQDNPLDRWSRRIIEDLGRQFAATALFPSDGPPYMPFQRWAQKAEGLSFSPLGPLIHPRYGLWHAYRGALAFAKRLEGLPEVQRAAHPCDTCADKPCLKTCPVAAFSEEGYDVQRCVQHISRPEGENCMTNSCLARRACPVGRKYLYEEGQSRFHMAQFLKAQQRR